MDSPDIQVPWVNFESYFTIIFDKVNSAAYGFEVLNRHNIQRAYGYGFYIRCDKAHPTNLQFNDSGVL